LSQETVQLVVGLIALLVLVGLGAMWMRKRRTEALRSRFGTEYDRLEKRTGDPRKAEDLLAAREKRVAAFTIRSLPNEQRDAFVASWRDVQAQFVDDPKGAVAKADTLLGQVMAARGYPMADFAQRAADLSVDHSEVVTNYRTAHDIALRHERGEAGTEDLRQAMIHYRALFDDLVNEPVSPAGSGANANVRKQRA
jgi:FtsZ-interacting cell division protein ZipA